MGSILAKSEMQKKRIDEWKAIGLYPFLVPSISASVSEAISCLAEISSDKTFEEERTSIALSSSNMLPYNM